MFTNSLKKIVALSACMLAAWAAQAQDPEFTQFYAAPIYTNPALAGTAVCDEKQAGGRMVLNYRNQWPSLPGTFRTFAASFDQHVQGINGGIGLMAMRDVAGDGLLTTTSVSGIYSYMALFGGRKQSKRFALRLAIQAGLMQRSIDFTKLRFSDQILPKKGFVNPTQENLPNNSVSFPNFSAGALLYSGSFYAGLAVHNINEPNQSFFRNTDSGTTLPRRFTIHAGTVIPLKKTKKNQEPDMTISPNILIMTQQKFFQTNIGFYLNKGPFVAGLWFRQTAPNSDALIALVGFRYQKFKFGYSYDITVSSARSAAPGSHEISAAVEWCVKSNRRWKPLVCPSF